MNDRLRTSLELIGLLTLAASLIFVALQMQQDRKVALAQLNSSQLEMFVSRFVAGIESEAYLSAYGKYYSTKAWDRKDYTDEEVAALELDSIIWWTFQEMTYEHYREGLVSDDSWKETKVEILVLSELPVQRAVYEVLWKSTPSEFTRTVDKLLEEKSREDDT